MPTIDHEQYGARHVVSTVLSHVYMQAVHVEDEHTCVDRRLCHVTIVLLD